MDCASEGTKSRHKIEDLYFHWQFVSQFCKSVDTSLPQIVAAVNITTSALTYLFNKSFKRYAAISTTSRWAIRFHSLLPPPELVNKVLSQHEYIRWNSLLYLQIRAPKPSSLFQDFLYIINQWLCSYSPLGPCISTGAPCSIFSTNSIKSGFVVVTYSSTFFIRDSTPSSSYLTLPWWRSCYRQRKVYVTRGS